MKRASAWVACLGIAGLWLVGCGGSDGPPGPTPTSTGNAAPTVIVTAPATQVVVPLGIGGSVQIAYADDDPDDVATTTVYADGDGDLGTVGDQIVIAAGRPDQDGATQMLTWDASTAPAGAYRILARTQDASATAEDDAPGEVVCNAAPTVEVSAPLTDVQGTPGTIFDIAYADEDLEDGSLTWLFADLDGDPLTPGDQYDIVTLAPDQDGAIRNVTWDSTGVPPGTYHVIGEVWDGVNPIATHTAPGRIVVVPTAMAFGSVGDEDFPVMDLFSDGSRLIGSQFHYEIPIGLGPNPIWVMSRLLGLGSGQDGFVARIAADGTAVWARATSGYAYATLPDDTFLESGLFIDTITFDENGPNETKFTAPPGDLWLYVAKYAQDGTFLWARAIQGTGLMVNVVFQSRIKPFPDGSFALMGNFGSPLTFGPGEPTQTTLSGVLPPITDNEIFVARYAVDGSLEWATQFGGSGNQIGADLATHADGSISVVGAFQDEIILGFGEPNQTTFGQLNFPPVGGDAFVARLAPNGTLSWGRHAGGNDTENAIAVTSTSDGGCVVAGQFQGTATINIGEPINDTFTALGVTDLWLFRLDALGTLRWAKTIGGTNGQGAYSLATLPLDRVVLGGTHQGPTTFGAGEPGETILVGSPATSLSSDGFVASFDGDGLLQWARSTYGTEVAAVGVVVPVPNGAGAVDVLGSFKGEVVLHEATLQETRLFSRGGLDLFVARFGADGSP